MSSTQYEVRGAYALIRLDNPPINGLGAALREGLMQSLDRALADAGVKAIVITGSERRSPAAPTSASSARPSRSPSRTCRALIAASRITEAGGRGDRRRVHGRRPRARARLPLPRRRGRTRRSRCPR